MWAACEVYLVIRISQEIAKWECPCNIDSGVRVFWVRGCPAGGTTPCSMAGVTSHSHVHYQEMQWTPPLCDEALLAHDVCVCLERPSEALPPESGVGGCQRPVLERMWHI